MKNLLPLLPLLSILACASEEPTKTDTATQVDLTWQEMDFDQRLAYMSSDVLPDMQASFADHDPDRFETLTCGTCHGSGADDGSFAMPSDTLVPIDFAAYPDGPDVSFMETQVVPEMAALLDQEPFDPNTFEGFGCLGCHPAGS